MRNDGFFCYNDLMKQDYSIFYENITHGFTEKQKNLICVLNKLTTYLYYIAYPVLLVYAWINQRDSFLKLLCIPAISFLFLSLIRKKINRKRPYESCEIHPIIHKDTKGNSMPSRHIFSASLISMCFLYVNPLIGWILMAVTVLTCFVRVIGGVHYPSDVIVGLLTGMICGLFIFV